MGIGFRIHDFIQFHVLDKFKTSCLPNKLFFYITIFVKLL